MDYNALEKKYAGLLLDPDYIRLELLYSKPNIFTALKLAHYETRHSNFLGWLLDPNQTHGLGARFLKLILSDLFKDERIRQVSVADVARLPFEQAQVLREWKHIDLLIRIGDLVVVIENKIWASESKGQLSSYEQIINSIYPNSRKVFVFLSPYGTKSSMDATYVNYSYRRIIEILELLVGSYSESIPSSVKIYLEDYMETLKTQIMQNGELNALARKIYLNHQELFSFIQRHSPNPLKEIADYLYGLLVRKGWVAKTCDHGFVRFLTPELDGIIPMDSATWSGEAFLFEFLYTEEKLEFYFTIAPGNEATRILLKDSLQDFEIDPFIDPEGLHYCFAHYTADLSRERYSLADHNAMDLILKDFMEKISTAVGGASLAILKNREQISTELITE